MGVHGSGLELGMELTAQEPGVIRGLYDFDQAGFGIAAADREALLGELLLIGGIEFVAVPVPLRYLIAGVGPMGQRAESQHAAVGPQAHGAPLARDGLLAR